MVIDNLVEMHCHILPGIDDGSPNVETSLRMIEKLQAQGCKKIVLTPHYYTDTISLDDFLRRRDYALNELARALPPGSPELIPSAETFITHYLFNNSDLSDLCIGNSRYLLIEHPFDSSMSERNYDRLMNLKCNYDVDIILAHIERYPAFMENTRKLDMYLDMGCLAQVNISSFADAPKHIKKKLFKLLDTNRIHLIASDSHNMDRRPPEYEAGIKAIIDNGYGDVINTLVENSNIITR